MMRRIFWLVGGAVVLGVVLFYFRPRRPLPAPSLVPTISLVRSNGPLQVIPGQGGCLLILPDGSLWSWRGSGRLNPLGDEPVRKGEDSDWASAAFGFNRCLGIKTNGTLWQWGLGLGPDPVPIGSGSNWVTGALKTDDAYVISKEGALWKIGEAPWRKDVASAQLGAATDWKSLRPGLGECCYGIRGDGTLWVWGEVPSARDGSAGTNCLVPVQVCREANWVAFGPQSGAVARNAAGEFWALGQSAPNHGASIQKVGWHIGEVSPGHDYAFSYFGRRSVVFRLNRDGKLWKAEQKTFGTLPAESDWSPFDGRSDWVSLFNFESTALGLTADGTLWQWGVDPRKNGEFPFSMKMSLLGDRFRQLLGLPVKGFIGPYPPVVNEEPQPVLRMKLAQ